MKNNVKYLICIFMNINENIKKSIKTREQLSKSHVLLTLELTQGTQTWNMMNINDNRIESITLTNNSVSMTTVYF